jgi:hypothetical protein
MAARSSPAPTRESTGRESHRLNSWRCGCSNRVIQPSDQQQNWSANHRSKDHSTLRRVIRRKDISRQVHQHPAFVPMPAAPWMCAAVAAPVKLLNPAADPYPTARFKTPFVGSNVMPPEISPPVPVLFVTAGTAVEGLQPLLGPVRGDRSKFNR